MTTAHNEAHQRPGPRTIDVEDDDEQTLWTDVAPSSPLEEVERPAPARILLAEDDREFRSLVALRLRGAGFDVTEAADGGELLELLIDKAPPLVPVEKFDLILSDIHMPRFTALNIMAGARISIGETPVVLITAFGDAVTHERARHLGAAAVLDKPFRLDDLCVTICQILSRPAAKSRPVALTGKFD